MVEPKKLKREDFRFIQILGRGAYGRVAKAQRIDTGVIYAIKIVQKTLLKRVKPKQEGKEHMAYAQKNLLAKLRNHPGVIRLFYSFQDSTNLFYVLQFCPHGDLLSLIQNFKGLPPYNLIQHYSAQIVFILQQLHMTGIAHRDLKPENLLISNDFHLKLTDFGTARDYSQEMQEQTNRRTTFVGTAQYVSPQMLKDQEVGGPVDLWALGCIIYQMLVGRPPFTGATDYLIFEQIKKGIIQFPQEIPPQAEDLIRHLLVEDPYRRLGAGPPGTENDFQALKAHPFFGELDFSSLYLHPIQSWTMPESSREHSDDQGELEELNRRNFTVLMSGVIKKKSGFMCKSKAGMFYSKRILTITNQPKIFYSDMDNVYKGEIPLSGDLIAEVIGKKEFSVSVPGRTFFFRVILDTPQTWVETIHKVREERFG